MSAHKRTTITISEEEYRKLHEAAMKKRFVEKELPAISRELHHETQKAVQHGLNAMEQRQQGFLNVLEGFQEEIRIAEMTTQANLRSQQEELFHSLDNHTSEVWNELAGQLFAQQEEFSSQIHQEHEQRQYELKQLQTGMFNLEDEQERRKEIAQEWMNAAFDLHLFIDGTYDHHKFAPTELKKLENQLLRAEQNLDEGIPEAALLGAQEVYAGLSDLRIQLEEQWCEWETQYYAILEQARSLHVLLQENRMVKAVDLEGNELNHDIEVDFWSQGQLTEQINFVANLVDQLENSSNMLSTEMLVNLQKETLPGLSQQFMETITKARLKVIDSQIRINIADIVLQALQEQGFSYQKSGYNDGDMRSAFFASVENLEGSQVIIQVNPVSGADGRNELHIHSHDREMRSHHELRQRAREINQTLSRHGLQVGTTSTQPALAEDLMRNVIPVEQPLDNPIQRKEND